MHDMDNMQRVQENVHPILSSGHAPGGPVPGMRAGDAPELLWYLTEDITSSRGRQYGRAGERVQIIADHRNVMIVEGIESKQRFSVRIEKLTTKL